MWLAIVVLASATLAAGCANTKGARRAPMRTEVHAKRVIDRHLSEREFPGVVMALDDPDDDSVVVTAGTADANNKTAGVDPTVPWIIGSATKTFVAIVVLQLAQEGRIDLDRNIERWFPDLPNAARITPRQLLQHTSGLNDYLDAERVQGDAKREWKPRELIDIAVSRPPLGEPGSGHHYANTNYIALGVIIEEVTSKPWYGEVRTRILNPLGMSTTGYAGETSAPPLARGYVIARRKFVESTHRWHPSLGGAAGAMYSTAADLGRFAQALGEGLLLDDQRNAEMRTFVPAEDYGHVQHEYGLGLEKYVANNLTLYGHIGVASAHSSFVGFDPHSQVAVALQINSANPGPTAVMAAEAVGSVTGRDVSPPPMPRASFGYTHFPFATLRAPNGAVLGEVRILGQRVDFAYPFVFNEGKTRMELNAAYQRLQFNYRVLDTPMSSLQSISLGVLLTQELPRGWGLLFLGGPGYADDFHGDASKDALTLTLVGAGTYRFNHRFKLGLGVALQNGLGEPLPIPVASIEWTIAHRLWFEAILPANASLTWLPIDQLGLRASLLLQGNSYHGDPERYGIGNPQVNYSALSADGGLRWFILPWLHLTPHGGYTFYRRFEFSNGRKSVRGGKFNLENGAVFGIDLGFGG